MAACGSVEGLHPRKINFADPKRVAVILSRKIAVTGNVGKQLARKKTLLMRLAAAHLSLATPDAARAAYERVTGKSLADWPGVKA